MNRLSGRTHQTGSAPARTLLAWVVLAGGIGLIIWGLIVSLRSDVASSTLEAISFSLTLLAFLLSGAAIVLRQPRNVIGWLLMIPGLTIAGSELLAIWLRSMDPAPEQVTFGLWLALWFAQWAWILLMFPIFLLLLTFPDGRLLSPRWRSVRWLLAVMTVTMVLGGALIEDLEAVDESGEIALWSVPNPIGVVPVDVFDGPVFGVLWTLGLLTMTVFSVAAIVIRFRRGSREVRQQLKLPLYAMGFFGVSYILMAVRGSIRDVGDSGLLEVIFVVSLAGLPVSVAAAVLRYRLYDIDRLVSRTVSYGVVVGLLVSAFFGVVTLLTALLPTESDLAVAASTLAAAALFNPLRRRVQGLVDRRFNRSKYDAQIEIDALSVRLRQAHDREEITGEMLKVVNSTMEPSSVGVWLREA